MLIAEGERRIEQDLKIKTNEMNTTKIERFFRHCLFCETGNLNVKMLDADALIGADLNLAYPVHFKIKRGDKSKLKKGEG